MRILHITFSLGNAGKENMLVDIAGEQQKLGHVIAILIINNIADQSILNRIPPSVKIYSFNRARGSKNPLLFIKLFDILHRDFKPEVIHAHDGSFGKMLKMMFISCPIVLTLHNPNIQMKSIKLFDKLFAISRSVQNSVEKKSKLPCQLVYNGICSKNIQRKINYGIDREFRIVFVARLNHEIKGQDILIKAISRLINESKQYPFNIKLDLIGSGISYRFIKTMIESLFLDDNIELLGNQPREWVYSNLSNYHLFVQASRHEGFGLSVAEALAAGLPVVSSNIGGPVEILENGKFGLLFENDKIDSLVEKMKQVIIMYQQKTIKQLADHAYKHCIDHFEISKTAANYCRLYPVNPSVQ